MSDFPQAKLYGTARHVPRLPELPWEALRTEDPELHAMFAEDFDFSVPRGVDFISANENVHFSSVLVLHRASKTIHVDDTLMYVRLPRLMRVVGLPDAMSFHPTLAKALEKRAGAANDFRDWAEELAERWRDAENLCAAHTATLTSRKNQRALDSRSPRQGARQSRKHAGRARTEVRVAGVATAFIGALASFVTFG